MKQYLPKKPIKRGFKVIITSFLRWKLKWCVTFWVWVLRDSKSGYAFDFDVYTGKQKSKQENSTGLGEKVVLNFCKTLKYKHYKVFIDNYFTSISLFEKLTELELYGCGTIISTIDRKSVV